MKLFTGYVDDLQGYESVALVHAETIDEAREKIAAWNDDKGVLGSNWDLNDLREVKFEDGYWQQGGSYYG